MTPLFAQADFLGPAGLKSVLMHLQLSVTVTLCFFFYVFKVFIKAKSSLLYQRAYFDDRLKGVWKKN